MEPVLRGIPPQPAPAARRLPGPGARRRRGDTPFRARLERDGAEPQESPVAEREPTPRARDDDEGLGGELDVTA